MEIIFSSCIASLLGGRAGRWLQKMQEGLLPGRYRFCARGGLVPFAGQEGLVSTAFAGKILWNTGLWDKIAPVEQQAVIDFISSFQEEDGFFRDPWLLSCFKKLHVSDEDIEKSIRAETRQAISFLLTVGAMPKWPVPLELKDTDSVREYMRGLPWDNPWAACSHFSHQCFFLAARKRMGLPNPADMEECLVDELFKHYHPETGTWYDNAASPSMTLQVNGMMKAFTGMAWLSSEVYTLLNLENSWETVRLYSKQCDSCSLFNQLYVFSELKRLGVSCQRSEIKRFCQKYIRGLFPFYHWGEGAFSFYPKLSIVLIHIQHHHQ